MKLHSIISLVGLAALSLVACDGPMVPTPGPGKGSGEDDTTVVVTIDTTKAISFKDAIATAGSEQEVVIKGTVTSAFTPSPSTSGELQQSAWLGESSSSVEIEAYYCNITDTVAKNDYVAVQGKVSIYVKTSGDTVYEIKNGLMQILRKTAPAQLVGDGSEQNPYTVGDVITLNSAKEGPFYVKGYIVGQVAAGGMNIADAGEYAAPFTGNSSSEGTNILIADAAGETATTAMAAVQLPSGFRAFSLPKVPGNLGKEIIIYGKLVAYFSQPGIKEGSYFVVDGQTYGSKPTIITGEELLNESMATQASFDKFTIVNVSGTLTWVYNSQYKDAQMSGYASGATSQNEDWFISPAFDASNGGTLTFDHARGPKGSMSVSTDNYTVWVSNNFVDSVATATWTQMPIPTHGTTAWTYVSSGEMKIPDAHKAPNCRIAWKYVCNNSESATWEIKNIIVK